MDLTSQRSTAPPTRSKILQCGWSGRIKKQVCSSYLIPCHCGNVTPFFSVIKIDMFLIINLSGLLLFTDHSMSCYHTPSKFTVSLNPTPPSGWDLVWPDWVRWLDLNYQQVCRRLSDLKVWTVFWSSPESSLNSLNCSDCAMYVHGL